MWIIAIVVLAVMILSFEIIARIVRDVYEAIVYILMRMGVPYPIARAFVTLFIVAIVIVMVMR